MIISCNYYFTGDRHYGAISRSKHPSSAPPEPTSWPVSSCLYVPFLCGPLPDNDVRWNAIFPGTVGIGADHRHFLPTASGRSCSVLLSAIRVGGSSGDIYRVGNEPATVPRGASGWGPDCTLWRVWS